MDPNDIEDFKSRENREVERFRGSVAEYSFDKDVTTKKTSFIKNISIKGICIIVNRKIELNTLLYLVIHLPGIDPPMNAVGEVICQDVSTDFAEGSSDYFDLGVSFKELSDYNLGRLMRLLNIGKPYKP